LIGREYKAVLFLVEKIKTDEIFSIDTINKIGSFKIVTAKKGNSQ